MNLPQWKVAIAWFSIMMACCFLVQECAAQSLPFAYVKHKSYEVYYDMQRMSPVFVVYTLTQKDFAGSAQIGSRHFKKDSKLPRPWVSDDDFRNSGYVRGHLCPAGDRDSDKTLMKDTYYCSNIVPMSMVANSGSWRKVEQMCRDLCKPECRLLISVMPVFMDGDTLKIGKHRVSVPSQIVKHVKCLVHPEECITFLGDLSQKSQAGSLGDTESSGKIKTCNTYLSKLLCSGDERLIMLIDRYF